MWQYRSLVMSPVQDLEAALDRCRQDGYSMLHAHYDGRLYRILMGRREFDWFWD